MNQCNFIGNLGQDPEVRTLPNGDAVANISVACGEKWKDKNGQPQEHTEWVRVSFFGRQAEIVGQYLSKGSKVMVSGKLHTRKYQAQDGSDRYSTEIKGREIEFLDSKGGGGQQQAPQQQSPQQQAPQQQSPQPEFEDDIPF